jgi:hypothetical protein
MGASAPHIPTMISILFIGMLLGIGGILDKLQDKEHSTSHEPDASFIPHPVYDTPLQRMFGATAPTDEIEALNDTIESDILTHREHEHDERN